jgi:hypothetical protein
MGWHLDDAEERHRAAPHTFSIPDLSERIALRVGELVKLLFALEHGHERMWVRITERTADGYRGVLESAAATSKEPEPGAIIEFAPRHVAAVRIDKDDPRHPLKQARTVAEQRWAELGMLAESGKLLERPRNACPRHDLPQVSIVCRHVAERSAPGHHTFRNSRLPLLGWCDDCDAFLAAPTKGVPPLEFVGPTFICPECHRELSS